MQTPGQWRPTKAVFVKGNFEPSKQGVHVGSRLSAFRAIREYQVALAEFASGHLLDLGCGHVPYYKMYESRVQDVTCVDWAHSLHQNDFLDHRMDLNEPLQLPSETFDTILFTDVIEHIYRPSELICEIARVLRPNGRLIMGSPFFYCLHESPFDFYRYTEFALRRMCQDAGLTILRLTPYAGVPEVLIDVTAKCLSMRLPALSEAYFSICKGLTNTKLFRAISRRTASMFPLGYVTVAMKPQVALERTPIDPASNDDGVTGRDPVEQASEFRPLSWPPDTFSRKADHPTL